MKKKDWEVVEECNDDDGTPSCWVKEINSEYYGKFVWISINSDGKYEVEVEGYDINSARILKECNTLVGAKRWVAANIRK